MVGQQYDFNPRSPCGERQTAGAQRVRDYRFQSTLPMRGATQVLGVDVQHTVISIHAPHAGSDRVTGDDFKRLSFQSTLPMRGATVSQLIVNPLINFNPRSPCGERRVVLELVSVGAISIHAPHAGSDPMDYCSYGERAISIHAPHAGSDSGRE